MAGQPAGGAVATLEPVTIPLVIEEPARQTYIEILRRPDRHLVAVLELLSPANKTRVSRAEYLAQRNAILRQDVHLLELELLLQGERMPLRDPLPRARLLCSACPSACPSGPPARLRRLCPDAPRRLAEDSHPAAAWRTRTCRSIWPR